MGGGGENCRRKYLDRLQARTNSFFTFTQSFRFPVKIILGGNITKYQTHAGAIS